MRMTDTVPRCTAGGITNWMRSPLGSVAESNGCSWLTCWSQKVATAVASDRQRSCVISGAGTVCHPPGPPLGALEHHRTVELPRPIGVDHSLLGGGPGAVVRRAEGAIRQCSGDSWCQDGTHGGTSVGLRAGLGGRAQWFRDQTSGR